MFIIKEACKWLWRENEVENALDQIVLYNLHMYNSTKVVIELVYDVTKTLEWIYDEFAFCFFLSFIFSPVQNSRTFRT